jgi:hypothetical protein
MPESVKPWYIHAFRAVHLTCATGLVREKSFPRLRPKVSGDRMFQRLTFVGSWR